MTLKRWTIEEESPECGECGGAFTEVEDPAGDWVKWSDLERHEEGTAYLDDYVQTQAFFDLMQVYRLADRTQPAAAATAFEAVKTAVIGAHKRAVHRLISAPSDAKEPGKA